MSGSSSSMSIKTSPEITWGVSPTRTNTQKDIFNSFYQSGSLLHMFTSIHASMSYVSIPPPPPPPALVPPLGRTDTPPAPGWCTDRPPASSQTDGCRWLWWRSAACRAPHREVSEEGWRGKKERGRRIKERWRKKQERERIWKKDTTSSELLQLTSDSNWLCHLAAWSWLVMPWWQSNQGVVTP